MNRQIDICRKYGAAYSPSPPESRLGIALNVKLGLVPLNGLRHPPEYNMNGWYIWAGEEFSDGLDFFNPLCLAHIEEWDARLLPYLALPPGWRFLIADNYEDVWFDANLLDV